MKLVILGTLLMGWAALGWWCSTPAFNLTLSYLLICFGWTSWAYYTAPPERSRPPE